MRRVSRLVRPTSMSLAGDKIPIPSPRSLRMIAGRHSRSIRQDHDSKKPAPLSAMRTHFAGGGQLYDHWPRTAATEPRHKRYPLIIAIHGGSYFSTYFDAGFRFDQASALGFTAIALDRPGYGGSTKFASGEANIRITPNG